MTDVQTPLEAAPSVDQPSAERRRPRIGAAAWVFLVVALVGGLVFILVNPPFWGNDGLSQYSRAYRVSHGHLLPEKIAWYGKGDSYGGVIPSTVWDLYGHAAKDLGSNPPEPGRMILSPEEYSQLGAAPYTSDATNLIWFSNTAAYSPVPYAPAAVASLIAEASGSTVSGALTLMAIACLLAYATPVFVALVALRTSRARWLFVALALLPPALLQSATISADSLTNGLAILFAALMWKATLSKERLDGVLTGLLYATIILLPVCKPSYLVLILLAIAARRAVLSGPIWIKWASIALSTALWAIWTIATRGIGDVLAFYRADYETSTFGIAPMIADTFAHPIHFLGNVFRTFVYRDNFFFLDLIGSSNVRVPSTVMLAMIVIVVISAGWVSEFRIRKTIALWWWAIAVVSVLALFGTLYVTFTPVGFYLIDGVQGRYFFPLWPILIGALLTAFPLRWRRTRTSARAVAWIVSVGMASGVALTIVKFWYVVWVGA